MKKIEYIEDKPGSRAYLQLFETTGWNADYKADQAELRRAIECSWYVLSAYDGEELVGFGRIVSDGVLYAMIYDMIVKPSHQGNGIGTAILEKLVARCREHGLRDVQLFSAKGKAQFYRKRGFVERPVDAPGMRIKR